MRSKGLRKYLLLLVFCLSLVFVSLGDSVYFVNETPTSQFTVSNADENGKAVAYIIGEENVKYTSIERALDVASSGDVVTVIPPEKLNYHSTDNAVIPDKVEYTITRDCEIKSGVSLLIPTDSNDVSSVTDSSTFLDLKDAMKNDDGSRGNGYDKLADEEKYLRITVKITNGATLTNNGNLLVGGYLSSGTSGSGRISHTSHSYSRIVIDEGAKFVQSDSAAATYCFGYISEPSLDAGGSALFDGGSLYLPFCIIDYRGFQGSWAMTDGAIDDQRCSPFTQFEFRNIDAETTISYRANVQGIVNAWVVYSSGIVNVNERFYNTLAIVGNSTRFLIQLTDSTYSKLTHKYNPETGVAQVDLYGGATMNNLSLVLEKSIVKVDLSTTEAFFPLSYHQRVNLKLGEGQSSATYDVTKQRLKVMPGSRLDVDSGVTLSGSEISVYSAFYDGRNYAGEGSGDGYSPDYPIKDGGILTVASGGRLTATSLAGTVYANSSSLSYTTSSLTVKEPWTMGRSTTTNPAWTVLDYLEIKETLQVLSLSDVDTPKFYAACNTFTNYASYTPTYDIIFDEGLTSERTITISGVQKAIVLEDETTYRIELKSNIYKVYYGSTFYDLGTTNNISDSNSICGINSILSVSSNEFRVQSISITCSTPLDDDGRVPLYPESTGDDGTVNAATQITLQAEVVDIAKSYYRDITWRSGDEGIATVQQSSSDSSVCTVSAVSLGAVTIYAECDGIIGEYAAEVVERKAAETPITGIYITDDSGGSSKSSKGTFSSSSDYPNWDYHNDYSTEGKHTFYLNIEPADADGSWSKITWSIELGAVNDYNNFYFVTSSGNATTVEDVTSVTLSLAGSAGSSYDGVRVKCAVVDRPTGQTFNATFGIRYSHGYSTTCLTSDALISMADGSTKRADEIELGDEVVMYNHYTGRVETAPIIFMTESDLINFEIVNLIFEDGTEIETINGHCFFSRREWKYQLLGKDNVDEYIGDEFYSLDEDGNEGWLRLVDYEVYEKVTRKYGFATYQNINLFANGLLNLPEDIEGIYDYFDYEVGSLKYDEAKMQEDIDTYGLYEYEDWSHLVTYDEFDGFNMRYFKIAMGKGVLTQKKVEYLVSYYLRGGYKEGSGS